MRRVLRGFAGMPALLGFARRGLAGGAASRGFALRGFAAMLAFAGIALAAHAQGGRVPLPVLEVDKSTTCVAPPEVMRRTHMNMLKHRRDRTVHEGVRGGDEALTRCLECHASRATGAAIGSRDAFCQSCHDYVGVKLDCFDCHQGRPGAVAHTR